MTRYPTLRDALVVVEHGGWVVRDIGLLDSVNRLDPLVDGNKRLSLVLADIFFAMNGRRLEAGQDEMVELILTIASEHLPLEETATWLAAHTR